MPSLLHYLRFRGKPPRNVRCAVEEDHGSAVSLVREPFVKTHIPPAEAERNLWSCTFGRMESSGRQQCHGKSEVLEGLLQPEEQLASWICDYGEPFKEAMWLDLVKERLTEEVYTVPCFVRDTRLIFHNHKMFYKSSDFGQIGLDLEAEFEKDLKEMFIFCKANENSFQTL